MTDKKWAEFLDWLYKAHSLTRDWTPSKLSIEIWEEFKKSKRSKKGG